MRFLTEISDNEKAGFESKLKEQFGISHIPGKLFMRGRERIFLYTGNLSKKGMDKLSKLTFIERVGVYFAKIDERDNTIRLSIEGTQILKDQIKNNLFQLDDEYVKQWMSGQELLIKTGKKGFLVIKYGDEFLGTGKASEEKIGNFIPKNRRLRNKG